jgi:thiosulfate dehydrogenase
LRILVATGAIAFAISACSGTEVERRSAAEHGRDLFSSTSTSSSTNNRFSCATCHPSAGAAPGRIHPGYTLAGATSRPKFWGGEHDDLLRAINVCRYTFMNAPSPWTANDEQAQAMYAFLASLPNDAPNALPFTVVNPAVDLPAGDAKRGADVYEGACKTCHGAVRTGAGRLRESIPALPDESANVFKTTYNFTQAEIRLTFIEKVRHGPFLGVFGSMPLFSKEAMSDADLSSLLSFLALY